MTIMRIIGLVLLAVGLVFLILGLQATGTFREEVRQELTGEYSSRTVWFIVIGVVGLVAGAGLAIFGRRPAPTRADSGTSTDRGGQL